MASSGPGYAATRGSTKKRVGAEPCGWDDLIGKLVTGQMDPDTSCAGQAVGTVRYLDESQDPNVQIYKCPVVLLGKELSAQFIDYS